MNDDHTLLKVGFGILAVLAILGALWRVLSYPSTQTSQTNKVRPAAVRSQPQYAEGPVQTLSDIKEQELLGDSVAPAQATPNAQDTRNPLYRTNQPFVSYPQNRASAKQTYPGRPSTAKRYVDTNFYDTNPKTPTQNPRATSYGSSGYAGPQVNFNNSSSRMQEERARMLAPYLRPNGQEKARMDAQWNKLTAGLERAIAKALFPKSKKEEMIEKYTAQAQPTKTNAVQTPGFAGALSPVGEQLATQKQAIMQSMGRTFGGAAARQAGGIMDSFAGEVSSVLNSPQGTAEQKMQQVQQIAKKYQDKMDKLAEKNQYDKFVADRVAQDNKQKEELGALYPEQREQIGQLIDQTREKDLALATQNLPREEYFNQLAQNDQQLRNDIQQVVVQGGKSVQELRRWEENKNKEYLKELAEMEEKGQIQSVASVAGADERKKTQAEVEVQSPKILEGFVKSFGEETRKDVESILSGYEQTLKQIDDEKLSVSERQTKKINAMNAANRELFEVGREKIEALNIPDEQKRARIEQLQQTFNIQ